MIIRNAAHTLDARDRPLASPPAVDLFAPGSRGSLTRRVRRREGRTGVGHSPRGAEGRPPRAHDGVGFVFTESDPFCGVDLDACVDPKTGGVASWAEGIVRELDSYAEFSPSGTGLHVLLRAKLPSRGQPQGPRRDLRLRPLLHRDRPPLAQRLARLRCGSRATPDDPAGNTSEVSAPRKSASSWKISSVGRGLPANHRTGALGSSGPSSCPNSPNVENGGFIVVRPTSMVIVVNGPCGGPEVVSTSRRGLLLMLIVYSPCSRPCRRSGNVTAQQQPTL
jgi:hypothetical protein